LKSVSGDGPSAVSLTRNSAKTPIVFPEVAKQATNISLDSEAEFANTMNESSQPAVIMYDCADPKSDSSGIGSAFTFGFFGDDLSSTADLTPPPSSSSTTPNSSHNETAVKGVFNSKKEVTKNKPNSTQQEATENKVGTINDKTTTVKTNTSAPITTGNQLKASLESSNIRDVGIPSSAKINSISKPYPMDVDTATFNYFEIIGFIKKAWETALRNYETAAIQQRGAITTLPFKTMPTPRIDFSKLELVD
jgi:hypothetical protein